MQIQVEEVYMEGSDSLVWIQQQQLYYEKYFLSNQVENLSKRLPLQEHEINSSNGEKM